MSRNLPLFILLGAILAVGILFFQVVQPFIFPLFLAAALAIIFRPVYAATVKVCRGHSRLAAGVTVGLILLMVMLPLGGSLYLAGRELLSAGTELVKALTPPEGAQAEGGLKAILQVDPQKYPRVAEWLDDLHSRVSPDDWRQLRSSLVQTVQNVIGEIGQRTSSLLLNTITFVMSFFVLILSLYYFFADGPKIIATIHRLSPLDDEDERVLFRQFESICRAVVLATLASALAQGGMALIGMTLVGIERVWLLSMLTVFFALVPFMGAAVIWVPVTIGLFLDGRIGAGIFMGLYGLLGISLIDNLIKPYVIQGQASMHPLLAFVCVLGGLRAIGLWGILVGPIVGGFFYALLNILHAKLNEARTAATSPVVVQEVILTEAAPAATSIAIASPPDAVSPSPPPPPAKDREDPTP